MSDELHIPLNERELEVLTLICEGLTTAEIGEQLHLSKRTIENYKTRLFTKADVHNSPALVAWAFRNEVVK